MNKIFDGYVNNMARRNSHMVKSYVLEETIGLVVDFMTSHIFKKNYKEKYMQYKLIFERNAYRNI